MEEGGSRDSSVREGGSMESYVGEGNERGSRAASSRGNRWLEFLNTHHPVFLKTQQINREMF